MKGASLDSVTDIKRSLCNNKGRYAEKRSGLALSHFNGNTELNL